MGKSLYAEQLAHWFARIPEALFWLEALEDFAAEPRRAFERVLEWLGLPAYGADGFAGASALDDVLRVRHNAAEHPRRPEDRAVVATLEGFFRRPNARLELLLTGELGDGTWGSVRTVLRDRRADLRPPAEAPPFVDPPCNASDRRSSASRARHLRATTTDELEEPPPIR